MATTSPHFDLDTLLLSLPACRRCRKQRRGCDTLLPKCRQCTKSKSECLYWDDGRKGLVARSYIAELVTQIRTLSDDQPSPPPPTSSTPASLPTVDSNPFTVESSPSHLVVGSTAPNPNTQHRSPCFAYAQGSFRYLGGNSCIVRAPRYRRPEPRTTPATDQGGVKPVLSKHFAKISILVRTYRDVVQPLFPIVDASQPCMTAQSCAGLDPTEAFCLNMMCSIACYLAPETQRKESPTWEWRQSGNLNFHHYGSQRYRKRAQEHYKKAMVHLEAPTSTPSITALRAVLLLAVSSLFNPKTGNIGQQVALASRLAIELDANFKVQRPLEKEVVTLRDFKAIIFCLENEFASTLDRPTFSPEPDFDLCFDQHRPFEFLCSLYKLQYRFRKGDESVQRFRPRFDDRSVLNPALRMILHQTHLLLEPCWGTAWYVLEAVVAQGSFHLFLTPHWVYRAGCFILENMTKILPENLMQLYSNALVILELSSSKWPHVGLLRDNLVDYMQRMKSKYRPDWKDKLYDVSV
ncbi:hypothetical protein M011DRAFT_464167 [Sporormia fimetaria CBS 119925]|uniref:Zn(2)-C6 fungal-type domain-containing protein n=1 Tax=Sporormia fimetaria CBS 119925 TaxID=1340428 RepID=A0A6A6VQ69_9PLEO|nr:hypothetical protein M011DRAFT_464167 [Sporormia fimetaria CBS 119925]